MYEQVTRDIRIAVEAAYLEDQSAPEDDRYVWSYTVRIQNEGDGRVQLRARAWRITDSFGRTQEVRGPGVVGEQPVIAPGEQFEYTSGAPLTTPSGIMVGSYQMESETGESFEVDVPAFSLDSPHDFRSVH